MQGVLGYIISHKWLLNGNTSNKTNLIQAKVFVPPMFMEHEPQIPVNLEGKVSDKINRLNIL